MDEPTFEAFYERTKHSFWRYIIKMMKNESVSDDIFQDAYIKFYQSPAEQLDERRMKSYLYRIATNLMHDHWRKEKRGESVTDGIGLEEPARGGEQEINLRIDITEALSQLSPRHRSLLWLAHVEGFEHKEIGQILELREKSVKVLLFRAKQHLLAVCRQMGITSGGPA